MNTKPICSTCNGTGEVAVNGKFGLRSYPCRNCVPPEMTLNKMFSVNEIELEEIKFSDFISKTPIGKKVFVKGTLSFNPRKPEIDSYFHIIPSEVKLNCTECKSDTFFDGKEHRGEIPKTWERYSFVLHYVCRNCKKTLRAFAIQLTYVSNVYDQKEMMKFGEYPFVDQNMPTGLIKVLGSEQNTFLKGRKCETLGLGIGAFAYYRRIVENQKHKLLDQIIKVANTVGSNDEVVTQLEKARNEQQFSKAVDDIKEAIPEQIRIKGHNPLTLLHSALSQGIHCDSDDECLRLANSIREILYELINRISDALKDQRAINDALSNLLNPPTKK